MNISYVFSSGDDFVRVNPWFYVAVDNRFDKFLYGDRLKHRIQNVSSEQFPQLFNHHVATSDAFRRLLEQHRDSLQAAANNHVADVKRAAEDKVRQLVNNDQAFGELRQDIRTASAERTEQALTDLRRTANQEEQNRNKKLERIESELSTVKNNQFFTFVGGALLGGLCTLAFKK